MAGERGSVGSRIDARDSSDELPLTVTARFVRVALVVLLVTTDFVLAGAGVYLIFKWRAETAVAPEESEPVIANAVAPGTSPAPPAAALPDAPASTVISLAPPATLPIPPPPPRLLPSTIAAATTPPSTTTTATATNSPKRDVLPPKGSSLPTKPIEPGVMKNPHAGTATAPDGGVAAAPESPGEPAAAPASEPKEAPLTERPLVEQMTVGIRSVVDRHRPDILDCYRKAARTDSLQGRLEVHIRIVPGGDVADVRVVQNGTGSAELGECLVKVMQTWRYPDPGAEAMEFVWPFTFSGQRGRRNAN